jgi:hypothetical protein
MGEGVFHACGAKRLWGLDRAPAGLHISAVKDRWRKGVCVRGTSPYWLSEIRIVERWTFGRAP